MGSTFQVNNVTKQGYDLFDRKVIGKSLEVDIFHRIVQSVRCNESELLVKSSIV